MSPLVETFANASKRGWSVASLGGGSYFMAQMTGFANGSSDRGGIAFDATGNVYSLSGVTVSATQRAYLFKMDPNGTLLWQKYKDSNSLIGDVVVNSAGNPVTVEDLYIGGVYRSALTQYSASTGSINWQNYIDNASGAATSLAIDSSNNLYATGDNAYWEFYRTNSSGSLTFSRLWSVRQYYSGDAEARQVAVDSSGNYYLVGDGWMDDGGDGARICKVIKIDSSNTLQWQRWYGGLYWQGMKCVAVDSSGNVYAGMGHDNSRVVKTNSSGIVQWHLESPYSGSIFWPKRVKVDAADNLYIFGKSPYSLSANSYIIKMNSSGTVLWQRSINNLSYLTDMKVSPAGDIYLTGTVNNGQYSVFIAKLPTDGSKTGTYTVGGNSFTYAASSLTLTVSGLYSEADTAPNNALSYSQATTSYSVGTPTYTYSPRII